MLANFFRPYGCTLYVHKMFDTHILIIFLFKYFSLDKLMPASVYCLYEQKSSRGLFSVSRNEKKHTTSLSLGYDRKPLVDKHI